jgi:hypothetical protein
MQKLVVGQDTDCRLPLLESIGVDADQNAPLYVRALPLSTAAQKVAVGHDTDCRPGTFGSV